MTVAVEGTAPQLQSPDIMAEQEQKKSPVTIAQLKELSSYFSELIDTIPAKVYFSQNSDVIENIEVNKRAVFEDSNLSNKAKNKRIKLDPTQYQKVSDVANAFHEKKKTENKMGELKKKLAKRIKELRAARGANEPEKKNRKRSASESSVNGSVTSNGKSDSPSTKIPKIYNKEGNLVFSKFDFASHVDLAAEKALEKSKEKKPSLKGLLSKAKKEDDKITRLEQTNQTAATKLKEKKMWQSALEKAEGNKVKDNPKLLEKALSVRKKLKVKHAKAWEERKNNVESRMKKKQERRRKNLDDRKQKKQSKKLKFLKKKGRIPD